MRKSVKSETRDSPKEENWLMHQYNNNLPDFRTFPTSDYKP